MLHPAAPVARILERSSSALSVNGTSCDRANEAPLERFNERHYTVIEIAERWNLSRDVVRKLFEDEPDVLVLGNDGSRIRRGYHTLRIPESVMERVHRRLCNPGLTVARSQA